MDRGALVRSYEAKKERALQRTRSLASAGRDIAPLPVIINPVQKVRCRNNFKLFCETYLNKWFSKSWGKNHLILIDSLVRTVLNGEKLAVAMPRGSGKTTLCVAAVIWSLLYGHRRFICVLSATSKDSGKIIQTIIHTLENNNELYKDFPEVVHPIRMLGGSVVRQAGQTYLGKRTGVKLSTDHLRLPSIPGSVSSGSIVISRGVTGSIRGQSVVLPNGEIARPDLIILDDIQKDDLAVNASRVDALETKTLTTIAGLAESGKELPMISACTVIAPDDLADRWLDTEKRPEWHGIRGKMLNKMPTDMDMWREYRALYLSSPDEARKYYRENKEAMSEGAEVSWEDDYDPEVSEDALETAMRYWSTDERAFWAERQNSPMRPESSGIYVESRIIATKLNTLKYAEPQEDAYKLTAFVDVHDDLLYYAVSSWDNHFTGTLIDYGTFPEQVKSYFRKSDGGLKKLQDQYQQDTDTSLRLGLSDLLTMLSTQKYITENGTAHGVSRILVDSGYKPEIVEQAIILSKSPNAIPSKGVSITAKGRPITEWKKQTGRTLGWHLVEEKIQGRRFKHLLIDVNYWKTRVHQSLALNPLSRSSFSLYGTEPRTHRMIADHLTSENPVLVSANGREVYEWSQKPNADNHYLDCVVGCMAGASSLGILTSDNPKYS